MTFYGNQHTQTEVYTYDQLVQATEELATELGRSPTTREADADDRFPSLSTIYRLADRGWGGVLDDAGLERTQVRGYGPDEKPRMVDDLIRVFDDVETPYLTHRQYDDRGNYPTSVVKEHFGSWKEACDAADIPAGKKHGTRCTGPQGERLDSYHELHVALFLHDEAIAYISHPPIEDTGCEADFYLPEVELWVEVDGYIAGTRPNEQGFERKIEHLRGNGEDVVVVYRVDELRSELRDREVEIDN